MGMHSSAYTGRYIGSGWTKASFFLTARLNLLLLSSNSTMSVEWTILQQKTASFHKNRAAFAVVLSFTLATDVS